MATLHMRIYNLDWTPSPEAHAAMVDEASSGLRPHKQVKNFVIGKDLPEEVFAQAIFEMSGSEDAVPAGAIDQVNKTFFDALGGPMSSKTIETATSPFAAGGAATAPIVEYVQVWFPSSRLTPEFRASIEADFARFDDIFKRGSDGDGGLNVGWSVNDQDHEGVEGGKARCFFVMRGWESMEHFGRSVQSDAAKEALPIVTGWNAPYEMV